MKLGDDEEHVLERLGVKKKCAVRYLVVGLVERSVLSRFGTTIHKSVATSGRGSTVNMWIRKHVIVDEDYLKWTVKLNPIVAAFLEIRDTFRFKAFGLISRITPVYTLDPPILFYKDAVNFNRSVKGVQTIRAVAENMASLSLRLREKYNLETIYVIVPNKVSIYGLSAGEVYDGFLPRLYSELDSRDVLYVDLYDKFMRMRNEKMLYHPAGTHWNRAGSAVAMSRLKKVVLRERRADIAHGR